MTNRLNTPSAVLVALAEEQSEALGEASAILESVSWELDAALSALRKDEAGYRRANAANRSGGDNYTPGELETASRRAAQLLVALSPALELAARWDREDLDDARDNVIHLDYARLHNERRPSLWSRLFSWRWSDVADVAA